MGQLPQKAAEDIPAAKRHNSTQERLLAFNLIQWRLACNHLTLRPRITRPLEVVDVAAHDRAYHGARVGIQEVQIHFQNRLTCRHFQHPLPPDE